MEWLIFAAIVAGVKLIGSIVAGAVAHGAAEASHTATDAALDVAAQTQKDRLKDELDATKTQVDEAATTVAGAQTAIAAASGLGGGEGTAPATLVRNTESLRERDKSLLDQKFANAVADIDAQLALAKVEVENMVRATDAAAWGGVINATVSGFETVFNTAMLTKGEITGEWTNLVEKYANWTPYSGGTNPSGLN